MAKNNSYYHKHSNYYTVLLFSEVKYRDLLCILCIWCLVRLVYHIC